MHVFYVFTVVPCFTSIFLVFVGGTRQTEVSVLSVMANLVSDTVLASQGISWLGCLIVTAGLQVSPNDRTSLPCLMTNCRGSMTPSFATYSDLNLLCTMVKSASGFVVFSSQPWRLIAIHSTVKTLEQILRGCSVWDFFRPALVRIPLYKLWGSGYYLLVGLPGSRSAWSRGSWSYVLQKPPVDGAAFPGFSITFILIMCLPQFQSRTHFDPVVYWLS